MDVPEESLCEEWPEERLNHLFLSLKSLLVKYIKASHLLNGLPFLRPDASRIMKTERKSPLEAANLIFKLIIDYDEPGKWNKFSRALYDAKFTSLYKVCHACEKDEFYFYIEIFDLLSEDFAEHGVDILSLSKGMLHLESFTKTQFERIEFILDEEGEVAASLEFISYLPSNLEKWIKDLLHCLFSINKTDLSMLIQKKGNEIVNYPESNLGKVVQLYKRKITEKVRPQDIKIHLKSDGLLSDVNLKYSSSFEEMEAIMLCIENSSSPGKWRSFVHALKLQGYEKLYNMLTNEEASEDDEVEIQHLRVVATEVVKSLDVTTELMNKVTVLINQRCCEEIKKKKEESGNIAAADMLLENIHRFKSNWCNTFLRILDEVDQITVGRMINPDFSSFSRPKNTIAEEASFSRPKNTIAEEEDFFEKTKSTMADEGYFQRTKYTFADEATKVKLPNLIMGAKYKKPIYLTIHEDELLTGGNKKINCIIYIVARRNVLARTIIKMHLNLDEKHKVVFLGSPTSVKLMNYLLYADCRVSDFQNNASLKNELMRNHVVLLTPETLKKSSLEKLFTHFSLLMIDDCYLTIKDHPFNNVMKNYIDSKLDNSLNPLPQVIGLTSSLSHEKPKTKNDAEEQIKKICANLDCENICALQDGVNYFAFKSQPFLFNQADCETPFKKKLYEIMSRIERHLKDSHVSEIIEKENPTLFASVNACINNRDGLSYAEWLADLKQGINSLTEPKTRFHCLCCWYFLDMLNKALEFGTYCEIKHAFDFTEDELSKLKINSEIYKTLLSYWEGVKDDIRSLSKERTYPNHQLKSLQNAIEEEIKKNPWSRIVVFVKTSILVPVIVNWMMDDEKLRSLLPFHLQTLVHKDESYKNMIETFNHRESQLCVITLEDWKQIHQNYNLRLDYFDKNEISSKGSFQIETQMQVSNQSDGNSNPEFFLHKAMIDWKKYADEDSEAFQKEIRKYQRNEKIRRTKKEDSNKNRPLKIGEFEIHCKYCDKFACFSSEIRKFEGERFFVCNPNFVQKVNVGNETIFDSTKKAYKLIKCINCYREWGKIKKENLSLPELKINSFSIIDVSQRIVNVDEWYLVPFFPLIQEVTQEELVKMTAK